jgi:uncharacterized protein YhhL (DUF1145 family)
MSPTDLRVTLSILTAFLLVVFGLNLELLHQAIVVRRAVRASNLNGVSEIITTGRVRRALVRFVLIAAFIVLYGWRAVTMRPAGPRVAAAIAVTIIVAMMIDIIWETMDLKVVRELLKPRQTERT